MKTKKSSGKVRGGNAHERDLKWHAESKTKAPKAKPAKLELPVGILLEKARVFEVEEPMNEEEARNARHNASEAKAQLDMAVQEVEYAKAELKALKATEEERRTIWDERAMLIAKSAKKVKVSCRVQLENDGWVRAYDAAGKLIDEREATIEEIKKSKQPELFEDQEEPPPARGAEYDAKPGYDGAPALEGDYAPPARALPPYGGDDQGEGHDDARDDQGDDYAEGPEAL
jgi:hypothetical protein